MISGIKDIELDDFTESFPAFATIVFMIFTSNIANGISIGIISYALTKLLSGRYKEIHWGTYILCIPLIAYFIM